MSEKRLRKKESIVDEAIKVIHEKGVKNFTLRELAKNLGITEPALYRYFNGKGEIIECILEKFKEFHLENFKKIERINGPYKKIRILLENSIDFFAKNPEIATLFLSEDLFFSNYELKEKLKEISTALQKKFKELLNDSFNTKNKVDMEAIGIIISGSLRALVMNWRLSDFSFDIKEKGYLVIDTLIELLRNYFGDS